MIREIINKRKGFKMEVIIDQDKCITDPREVTDVGTRRFQEWFERSDKERERDVRLQRIISTNDREGFNEMADEASIPKGAIDSI